MTFLGEERSEVVKGIKDEGKGKFFDIYV